MDISNINWKEVLKDVMTTFGIITDPTKSDAVYVLKSGKILDTKGPYANHQHENIANYITDKYGFPDLDNENGSKFFTRACNAVRLTPWLNAFYIPKEPMTEAQQKVLKDFINKTRIDEERPLLIATYGGHQQIEVTKRPADVDEFMKAIMYYYIDGQLIEMFEKKESDELDEKIAHLANGDWQVQSEKGRNMGTYNTKKEAEKRLQQVHYFKHMNEYSCRRCRHENAQTWEHRGLGGRHGRNDLRG